jgi:mannose-6-phosphate isomerase
MAIFTRTGGRVNRSVFPPLSNARPATITRRMEPITFTPLYMERVWGGRELEHVYGRHLPDPDLPFGESWEIVDREKEQSIVDEGPFSGTSLHELWTNHREEIFGAGFLDHPRFPILIKVLDARDDLSIQVHPPVDLAASLGGEPKTEMWFIADCDPGAKLHVGLKHGVTRADFEKSIADGTVADCVHAITPQPGESIFIASGRLHAIGAGFLIHEIQQNSDTTYRVFDWNRLGLDGKPRELHVDESLASIDFSDFEPAMDTPVGGTLAACEYFKTDRRSLAPGEVVGNDHGDRFSILSVVGGQLESAGGIRFGKGKFILLPRHGSPLKALEDTAVLQITLPK